MYNPKDILTRLKKGEAAEDIAQEMFDVLNEAVSIQKKEISQESNMDPMEQAASLIQGYINENYPELVEVFGKNMIDAEGLEALIELIAIIAPVVGGKKDEDPIAKFLKEIGV